MANFRTDILEAVNGQEIQAVVILSVIDSYSYGNVDARNTRALPHIGKILAWEQAANLLDYEFDDGFGGMDCHNVLIYTKADVYYVHEYDGSTCLHSVPRNPTELV